MVTAAYEHPRTISYRLLLTERLDSNARRRLLLWAEAAEGVRYTPDTTLAPGGVVTYTTTGGQPTLPAALGRDMAGGLEHQPAYTVVPLSPHDPEAWTALLRHVANQTHATGCVDCGAPIVNPHAVRCGSCGAKWRHQHSPPRTRFDPERARTLRQQQVERARADQELAARARAAGMV